MSFAARERDTRPETPPVELWSNVVPNRPGLGNQEAPKLLATLGVGDRLPWRLARDGEPRWPVVVEVTGASRYRGRYPDGTVGEIVDSE
jgi:hypothetical protein